MYVNKVFMVPKTLMKRFALQHCIDRNVLDLTGFFINISLYTIIYNCFSTSFKHSN